MRSLFFRQSEFPHRMNKDGTIDSICPRCYATIGTSTREADLKRMEAAHVCEPSRLSHFEELRRRPIVREEPTSGQDHDVALPLAHHSMEEANQRSAWNSAFVRQVKARICLGAPRA